MASFNSNPIPFRLINLHTQKLQFSTPHRILKPSLSSRRFLQIPAPHFHQFLSRSPVCSSRTESISVHQLQCPLVRLVEYMSLSVSQYSVLDVERIELVRARSAVMCVDSSFLLLKFAVFRW